MDSSQTLSIVQRFQLDRLQKVLERRTLAQNPTAKRLIDSGIASLYLSCIDAGVGERARLLIDSYRRSTIPVRQR